MELLTEEIKSRLQDVKLEDVSGNMDAQVIVKLFNPVGAGCWLIVYGEEWDNTDDWWLYGYVTLGLDYGSGTEWEWGPVLLSDLEKLQLPMDMKVERDLYRELKTVKEMANE